MREGETDLWWGSCLSFAPTRTSDEDVTSAIGASCIEGRQDIARTTITHICLLVATVAIDGYI
jgi:hypothetical protein